MTAKLYKKTNKTNTMTEFEPKVIATARYSRKSAAELLGVNVSTINRMVNNGYLKCGIRLTGSKFYTGSEILRAWHSQL